MEDNGQVGELIREIDAIALRIARERAEGQQRIARRASVLAGVDVSYSAILMFETLIGRALRVTELADSLGVPWSTVSRQIQDLERKGLIERAPDKEDGRARIVTLTEEGLRVAEVVGSVRMERLRHALNGWPLEDLMRVKTLYERLAESLRST